MIISTDAENTINKIQQGFMIKLVARVGLKGTYLNSIKTICNKSTVNINLNRGQLELISLKSVPNQYNQQPSLCFII